jgi:hypothetical protein
MNSCAKKSAICVCRISSSAPSTAMLRQRGDSPKRAIRSSATDAMYSASAVPP